MGKRLNPRHLISIDDLQKSEVEQLLNNAASYKEVSTREVKKVPALRGKTIALCFVEPSTRTRASFEIAAKRLSADTLAFQAKGSSLEKGETIKDMAKTLQAMKIDALVLRHSSCGIHCQLTDYNFSVINAGDGTHEHPTQALLDLFTIKEKFGYLEKLKVAIVGDILHSRVARSLIKILKLFEAEITLVAPPTLLPSYLINPDLKITHSLEDVVQEADVVYLLRIQKERAALSYFPSEREYIRFYSFQLPHLQKLKKGAFLMHPGPINRGWELASEVADSILSLIDEQVENGVAMRMAILSYLLTGEGGS